MGSTHKIEELLRVFASAFQTVKIYTIEHRRSEQAVQPLYQLLKEVLALRGEVTIGIVEGEFAFEKEIFFDLSRKLKGFIRYLSDQGVEKLTFIQGIQWEELIDFLNGLAFLEGSLEECLTLNDITHIQIEKIADALGGGRREAKGLKVDYQTTITTVEETINNMLEQKSIDGSNIKFDLLSFFEINTQQMRQLLALMHLKKHDAATFVHSLNVAILAMFFSLRLGLKRKHILEIGLGGLFHDIGKLCISRSIIQKPSFLTEEEYAKIGSHTILGAKILLPYVDVLGRIPILATFEHHKRYDGGGYPKMTFMRKPALSSAIIAICDVYDALRQRRSYKRDYPPLLIYRIMQRERSKSFEPALLDKFFEILGVWPIGTIVELDSGQLALVTEENKDDIFHPQVEVLPERRQTIDLSIKDSSGKYEREIIRSLNPLSEGKSHSPYADEEGLDAK